MTSRTASKRASTNGHVTPKEKPTARLQLLRVNIQWEAVYTLGDEPPETIQSQVITIPARDWPGVRDQINGDLGRILEQINEAGGFSTFQAQLQAQQAQAPTG